MKEECSRNLREAIVLFGLLSHTITVWCTGTGTKSPHFSLLPHTHTFERTSPSYIPRWHARRYSTTIFPAREERQSALFLRLRFYVRPARRWVLPLSRSKLSIRSGTYFTLGDNKSGWTTLLGFAPGSTASNGIATLGTPWSRASLYERGLLLLWRAGEARRKCGTWWQ